MTTTIKWQAMDNEEVSFSALPIIDLSWASSTSKKPLLLKQLHDALFNVGFLYIKNHGVPSSYISDLASLLPSLFDLPDKQKNALSKLNSPHFLGYSGYHDAVQALSYRFVHLIEEAFDIPTGTFDDFFRTSGSARGGSDQHASASWMPPQHRIKLVKYPPNTSVNNASDRGQGVGAHKDSSGWLTFLYQVGEEEGLEVLNTTGDWIAAPPVRDTFVVNFGNAFEAATEGAVKATVHRVKAPISSSAPRYSIPFFQGLPLDMTVSEIRAYIPEHVRNLRIDTDGSAESQTSSFLDPRWDSLGESQLRKWIRSHPDVGRKWYGDGVVEYYTQ